MFNPKGYYIPADFLATILFILPHGIGAWVLGTLLRQGLEDEPRNISPTQRNSILTNSSSRIPATIRAMVRAGMIATATGLGSQIGGWIGGIVVFVISSGLAAFFGISLPEHHDRGH